MSVNAVSNSKVRVLIVDDTRSIRAMIRAMITRTPEIEVVGEAGDPYEARELIRELDPDVITLDVEMPRMDGLSFLERIMRLRPMPVVMVSSRTTENSNAAIRALALGAVECVDIAKLRNGSGLGERLIDTLLMAAGAKPRLSIPRAEISPRGAPERNFDWNGKVVLIGSSTGGVDALINVLSDYPPDGPPTVIAQHMPAAFLASFTARLDRIVKPRVVAAGGGMRLDRGMVCIAPGGDAHIALSPRDALRLDSVPDTGDEQYIPSVNLLFSSAERHAPAVIGVMLTGMGRDGAAAMVRMHLSGSHTIVQDAETAVIDGMPRAARELGAAEEVVPLPAIGQRILTCASRKERVST